MLETKEALLGPRIKLKKRRMRKKVKKRSGREWKNENTESLFNNYLSGLA